jgi:hypothetical protein
LLSATLISCWVPLEFDLAESASHSIHNCALYVLGLTHTLVIETQKKNKLEKLEFVTNWNYAKLYAPEQKLLKGILNVDKMLL